MSDAKPIKHWDDRYGSDDYLFGTEPNDFLTSVADKIQDNGDVLCLADGEGRNGLYLAKEGHKVTSIDLSPVGLAKAEKLAAAHDVTITTEVADLSERSLGENAWDCIVSIFFHIPPAVRDIVYPNIIKGLKPGGLLILESYTPRQLEFGTGGPPFAELMLTEDDVRSAFSALNIEHCKELERNVVEGSGHTGQASVVQLLARKE